MEFSDHQGQGGLRASFVVVLVVLAGLASCSQGETEEPGVVTANMTDEERFNALLDVNGSLHVTYDYAYPLVGKLGENHEVIGRWRPTRSSLTRQPVNDDAVRDDLMASHKGPHGMVMCDDQAVPSDRPIVSCSQGSELVSLFHVALNEFDTMNTSMVSYQGSRNVSGTPCHAFTGNTSEPMPVKTDGVRGFDVCFNESTGVPLSFTLRQLDDDEANTVASLKATSYDDTVESDVTPSVPFKATKAYVDDKIRVVLRGFHDHDVAVHFGDRNATTTVSLSGDEDTYVEVNASAAGSTEASLENEVLNEAVGVPKLMVCYQDTCSLTDIDACLQHSGSPGECAVASRCRATSDGVCVERPRTCYGLSVDRCGEVETLGGAPCGVDDGECKPASLT